MSDLGHYDIIYKCKQLINTKLIEYINDKDLYKKIIDKLIEFLCF